MAAVIFPDEASASANGLLDNLFGTADSALDLYAKFNQSTKAPPVANPNVQATAAAAKTPAAGFAITPQVLLIGGAIVGGIVLVIVLSRK